jgi:hypothetical protein
MSVRPNVENVKKIYMSDASLAMLCDFERVLDSMDFYAFPNWRIGELVEGPKIQRYWVTCKFMWPRDRMPDPSAAKRLLPYGARISYQKSKVKVPVEIKSPNDFRPGTKKGKLIDFQVWFVDIMLPKKLLSDIKEGSVDIAGEEVDLTDLQNSMEKGLTDQTMTGKAEAPEMDMSQGGAANAAPADQTAPQ